MKFKYVFIGAGVATTYCVLKMLEGGVSGKDILIIDKGSDVYNRKSEEVMNGALGCGLWSDNKNVYSLTRGGMLSYYVGEEKALQLLSEVRRLSHAFHPHPETIKSYPIKEVPQFIKDSPLQLIQSETEHLGTKYSREIGIMIFEHFAKNGVNTLFNADVSAVVFDECYIIVKTERDTLHIDYDHLVLAVGKSGIQFMDGIQKQYNLATEPKAAQIGVRFESEQCYFQKLLDVTYDFKLYKAFTKNISIRTFCVNSNNCFVAIEENYGNQTFNGHSLNDGGSNGKVNFGLILEVKGVDDPWNFTKHLVEQNNYKNKGVYYSPSGKEPTVPAQQISKLNFIKGYGKYSKYVFDFIDKLNIIFNFGTDYIIYIPEVKYVTNSITLDKSNLSLPNYNNVHLAGDAAGARGITISGAHGVYIGEWFIKEDKK